MNKPRAAPAEEWSERNRRLAGWLSRTALGDRAAFEQLYRDTGAYLFGVVQRVVQERSLAEDVLQEVYVNVWRAAASFDAARAQPLTWLTHVARHRAIDALRRAKAGPETVNLGAQGDGGSDGEPGDDGPDPLERLPDPAAGPLERLQASAEAHALTHCIGVLTAEQRQCLALAYYQGLSHSETAEQLSQPLGTVKSWVRRALLSLRDCLARAGLAQAS